MLFFLFPVLGIKPRESLEHINASVLSELYLQSTNQSRVLSLETQPGCLIKKVTYFMPEIQMVASREMAEKVHRGCVWRMGACSERPLVFCTKASLPPGRGSQIVGGTQTSDI